MQWAIIAIRNLCQNNLDNQKFIRDSHKIKAIESSVIQNLGITIDQDPETGKAIGIVPLPKKN